MALIKELSKRAIQDFTSIESAVIFKTQAPALPIPRDVDYCLDSMPAYLKEFLNGGPLHEPHAIQNLINHGIIPVDDRPRLTDAAFRCQLFYRALTGSYQVLPGDKGLVRGN